MSKSSQAFRTIREVADWLDVAAHVLRFWESKFPQIKPVKRAGGRRYYRPSDMEIVGGIKVLLHDRGLTIRGVQKLIREDGVAAVAALSPPIDPLLGEDTIDGKAADWVKEAEAETLAAEPATPDPEPLQPEPSAEAEEDTSDQAVLPFAIDASAEDAEEAEEKDATAEVPAPEEAAARVGDETDAAPAAGTPAAVDPDEVIPGVALIQLCTWVAETDRLAKVDPATLETAVDALRALRDRMRADPETSAA